jgi:hypothetical protein
MLSLSRRSSAKPDAFLVPATCPGVMKWRRKRSEDGNEIGTGACRSITDLSFIHLAGFFFTSSFFFACPKKNEAKRKGTLLFWLYLLSSIRKLMKR